MGKEYKGKERKERGVHFVISQGPSLAHTSPSSHLDTCLFSVHSGINSSWESELIVNIRVGTSQPGPG